MFKILALILISVDFLFHLFVSIVDYRGRNRGIPKELSDVYDEEKYLKWKKYHAEKIRLEITNHIVSFALMLGLLIADVYSMAANYFDNIYVAAIIVLCFPIAESILIGAPFDYINTMRIEAKYGFNKATIGTFIGDQIKTLLISTALFFGLTCLFIVIYESLGDYILLLFTGIVFGLSLIIAFLYPVFSKIFNKFQSLEEGELRTALIQMLESHHYQVRDIKVMDASRRTTKSNAYFTGFGKSKTIVLYDNLLKVMSNEEILAIFAHEMGHGLHHDTLKNILVSVVQIALIVTLAWLLVRFPSIYADFGFQGLNYGFAVILLFFAVAPFVTLWTGLLANHLTRRAEYRADEQAVLEGYGEHLVSGLKTLYREDLGDLNPHPLIVLLEYSHPTLAQRVRHVEEFQANLSKKEQE